MCSVAKDNALFHLLPVYMWKCWDTSFKTNAGFVIQNAVSCPFEKSLTSPFGLSHEGPIYSRYSELVCEMME
jgi:hypothetical protein